MTGPATLDGYGKRILVMEERTPMRNLLARALICNGYNVYEATDRFEALASLGRRRYDAVLAGCRFSQPGDLLFLRICRQRWPESPMIVLSSDANAPTDLMTGLYACLPKPFDICDVLRLVHQATTIGEAARAPGTGVELAALLWTGRSPTDPPIPFE
jgi:DNA-binding NtrC family response regulator